MALASTCNRSPLLRTSRKMRFFPAMPTVSALGALCANGARVQSGPASRLLSTRPANRIWSDSRRAPLSIPPYLLRGLSLSSCLPSSLAYCVPECLRACLPECLPPFRGCVQQTRNLPANDLRGRRVDMKGVWIRNLAGGFEFGHATEPLAAVFIVHGHAVLARGRFRCAKLPTRRDALNRAQLRVL